MSGDFLRDEGGNDSIEYALVATIVSIAIIASLLVFRDSLVSVFEEVERNTSAAL